MGGSVRGNVVVPSTSLLGRDELVRSVSDDVGAARLVTLTGAGGVGKTRLATEVAVRLAPSFPDGVWMVALGALGDPEAVADSVATALGIAPQGEAPIVETLAATLAGRRLLLVLDNCEHVFGAVIGLVDGLLAGTGDLRILATSRRGLGTAGERAVDVPPLTLDGGASSPAVQLFAERARGVRPNFALDDDPTGGEAVVEICRVLDGLPLGIELAAARMAGMGVADVRDRLGHRFRLLEGPPDAPERQQSLPELVRWSFDLLETDEREVLQRAAVFAGGFDLEGYVGVYGVEDDIVVLRLLDRLVRSSLIVADHRDGRVRYRLLETIRQFGLDRLADASLLDVARDQHARYLARVASQWWEQSNGPGWASAVEWLLRELDNLRSAYGWSAGRDVGVAADITAHAALLGTSANVFEPIGWAESLIGPAAEAGIARLPRLHTAAGYACFVGRPETAAAHADRAMALEAEAGYDPCEPGLSAFVGALASVYAGDLGRYVELARLAASAPGPARAFAWPALVDGLQSSGQVEEALDRLDASVAAAREVGNPFWIAYALWIAGLTLSTTDPARARSAWDEGVEVVEEHHVEFFRGFLARDAARMHTISGGDPDVALALFEAAIDAFHQAGNIAQLIITLASVPDLFDRLERREAAATLHAAMTKVPASLDHVPELAGLHDRLTAALGAAVEEPLAVGAAMDLDQAVAYARAEIRSIRQERARSTSEGPPGGLTRRELEVLGLVCEGVTTRQIGERLFISAKTADRHIQNIYTKIGTSTRATATRWALEHGVVPAVTAPADPG